MLLTFVFVLFLISSFAAPPAWFNGANVPWDHFGYDIGTGSFDTNWFRTFFQTCQTNHINSARFWLHCGGAAGILYNTDGSVKGLNTTFISDLTSLVTMAKSYGVVMVITLWSFDMFKSNPPHNDLVADQTKTTSYINNALVPMVKALEPNENVIWEIMNEPEWAVDITPNQTATCVTLKQMQRFHGMLAEAIHTYSATHPVTTGSSCLKWNSDAVPPAVGNWWNDASLKGAYPSSTGVLDFYQIHYYDWMHDNSWGFDPCRENTTYWKLDKVTMVGELPSTAGDYYTPEQFMNCSYANGFTGTMYWAYNADWPLNSALPALNNFYNAHSSIASYSALVAWARSLRP